MPKEKIVNLSIKDEQSYLLEGNRRDSYFKLGFYTMKGAALLNSMLHAAVRNAGFKERAYTRYGYATRGDMQYNNEWKVGGGFIVKTSPYVTINPFNEIGLRLGEPYWIWSYLKKSAGAGPAELTKGVKEKLAYGLKQFWRTEASKNDVSEKDFVMPITDNTRTVGKPLGTVDYNQYRCLYELLKERKKEKTIKVYGKDAYDSIVGKPIDNAFMVSMIESIEQQIEAIKDRRDEKLKDLHDEAYQKKEEIDKWFEIEKDKTIAEADLKISEMKQQLKSFQEREAV